MWCGMVEMQCGMRVVWNVCCGIVCCAWCGVRWNVGVMWNGVPKCGGVNRCELWCDVKCGATDVECCHFRHGEMWTEMQNVRRE